MHKWWAKRLGSVFRGILLGSVLPEQADLGAEFYRTHDFGGLVVLDPFMGSGTTIGEAHKLGMTALGRDINPVAVEAVRTALGPVDRTRLRQAFTSLSETVGRRIRDLYKSTDSRGRPCNVLYYFWVMTVSCPECEKAVDLFPSFVVTHNAVPIASRRFRSFARTAATCSPGSDKMETSPAGLACTPLTPSAVRPAEARATCPDCASDVFNP